MKYLSDLGFVLMHWPFQNKHEFILYVYLLNYTFDSLNIFHN